MAVALHLLWDLAAPGATCTVDELERGVHEAGLERFTGLEGLHVKVWYRDGRRYGSLMVFEDLAAREACAAWVTERVTGLCGLEPVRIERFDVIAVAEGEAGLAGLADSP